MRSKLQDLQLVWDGSALCARMAIEKAAQHTNYLFGVTLEKLHPKGETHVA
jgi:hypothetical protein